MTGSHWARLKVEGSYPLRRGAWYSVSAFVRDEVVVHVGRSWLSVPWSAVELTGTQPRRWTVVPRPANAVLLPEDWGAYYAVCPECCHRAPLRGTPETMHCPDCNRLSSVAWDEPYLGRTSPPEAGR